MGRPFSGVIWLIIPLCFSLILGLPGCFSHNTTIESQLNLLVPEKKFIRTNIGLIGKIPIVKEDITLNHVPDPSANSGMLVQMVQGAWDGALSGLEAGQLFCWSSSGNGKRTVHISGKYGGTDALIFLILCGGGMVSGLSIGAVVGMVTPLVPSKHPTEILIARQHVVQGVWQELVRRNEEGPVKLGQAEKSFFEPRSHRKVLFGSQPKPYSAYMWFEHLHVGLFQRSYVDDSALTLVWNVQVTFFDQRRRMVAKQIIEMKQGEHSFETWADQEAFFLKEKLREGYRLIAHEIVEELTQTALSQ